MGVGVKNGVKNEVVSGVDVGVKSGVGTVRSAWGLASVLYNVSCLFASVGDL